jgi:hypothetical protein
LFFIVRRRGKREISFADSPSRRPAFSTKTSPTFSKNGRSLSFHKTPCFEGFQQTKRKARRSFSMKPRRILHRKRGKVGSRKKFLIFHFIKNEKRKTLIF